MYNTTYDAVEMAKSGGFVMFGNENLTIAAPEIGVSTPTITNIEVPVRRVSSKVSFVYSDREIVLNGLLGTFSNIQFAVGQGSKKVDITRPYFNKDKSVNFTTTAPTPFVDYSYLGALSSYLGASEDFNIASAIDKSIYIAENVLAKPADAASPVVGVLTYVGVKLKYTPNEAEIAAGGPLNVNGDFWVVYFASGIKKIYSTAAAAAGTEATGEEVIVEYTGGLMYYRLNLATNTYAADDFKKYSVLRNSYYQVSIKTVNDFGFNTEDELIPSDPTIPVNPELSITAEIKVQPWTVIEMPEDLQ